MSELVEFAVRTKKKNSLQKVVLLNRIPRCDSDEKAALSRYSNKAMREALMAQPDISGIVLRSLVLEGDNNWLFGRKGVKEEKTGKMPDGKHLGGRGGSRGFTKAAIHVLNTI